MGEAMAMAGIMAMTMAAMAGAMVVAAHIAVAAPMAMQFHMGDMEVLTDMGDTVEDMASVTDILMGAMRTIAQGADVGVTLPTIMAEIVAMLAMVTAMGAVMAMGARVE